MYPSDLTDREWSRLAPLLNEPRVERHAGGRPRKHEQRRVVDALLYVVKTGCQWRQLPSNFPPWKRLMSLFALGGQRRVGARRTDVARTGPQGKGTKRHAHSGDYLFAVGQDGAKRGRRGYDAGKKIKGCKRHIAVGTQGNLLAVIVHSAGIQGRVAARAVLMRLFCRFDSITTVFADGGYTGKLVEWAKDMFDYSIKIVKRNQQHLFHILPKRRVVERTFAWLNWSRRLSKDYELRHTSAESMIHIVFAHMLLRRYP